MFDVDNYHVISTMHRSRPYESWIGNVDGSPSPVALIEAEAIVARALIAEIDLPELAEAIAEPAAEGSSDIDLSDVDGLIEDTLG